jgi:hypothetical protein
MQSADDVLAACKFIRETGTSSRVPVPIVTLERLCADAKRWNDAPQFVREAAAAARAK